MSKNVSKTRLFVAGIATGVKQEAVSDYFREYGDFEIVWESNKTSKKAKGGLKRGHCILICYDEQQAEILMAIRSFKFLGRTLTVSEYICGAELAAQNKNLNQCRLILKKVPSYFTEQALEEEIAQRYGAVRTVFRFRHANPVREELRTSQFSVLSVIMETKESASILINLCQILLTDGSKILVEQYAKQGTRDKSTIASFYPPAMPKQTTDTLMFKNTSIQNTPNQNMRTDRQKIPYNTRPTLDQHHIKPTSKYNTRHLYTGAMHKVHENQNLEFRILTPAHRQ